MLYEIAQNFHPPFFPFSLYPPAKDRKAWEMLDGEWKKETLALGETYLHFPFPCLSAAEFMEFSRTGDRVRYEGKYFSKRLALDALVLAECVEDEGRFTDDIINGVFSICEESAWCLPAHNTYKRDSEQLILPDSTSPVLDLFACETGAVLSAALYLQKDRMDTVSPFIAKRIMQEMDRRIFTPYLNCHFWWMGNGKEPMNNWTIWCTQNVLLCAFLLDTDDTLRYRILQKACKSADYFLDEYGEDGCCDEGAQYYRHAGLCLFNTLEILNAVTGDHFIDLYRDTKIRNMASYILNVHVKDKYYINFADCSPIAGRADVREFLFAKRTGNPELASFAADDFLAGKSDTLLQAAENNLYYRLQNAFTTKKIKEFARHPIHYPDIFYPSAGIFVARDRRRVLAVKAGDNADSHNHNDCGSFTVYKDGRPFFIDVGVESYTKKTFSPQRYEIWTMQSSYHNLPSIDGYMQKDGEAYRASEVSYHMSDTVCTIRMDIASAYPKEADLFYYYREASLIKEKEIVIKDTFAFGPDGEGKRSEHSVQLSLMTYEKPVIKEEASLLTVSVGSLGKMEITGAGAWSAEEIPITDARLKTAWEHEIYRILVTASEKEFKMHIF